jgi:hypothetical protein
VFRPVPLPDAADLQALVQRITERLGRMLERRGLIERDAESAWLSGDPAEVGVLDELIGHSITYCIAVGPRAREARTPVPLREPPAGGDGAPGRAGAAAADAPDGLSRRVCTAQPSARGDHAGGSRGGRERREAGCRGARRA